MKGDMASCKGTWWIVPLTAAMLLLPGTASAVKPKAYTVPWVPAFPSTAHVTYTGKTVHLKGTSSVAGPTIMAMWDPGDGSGIIGPFNVTNQYDVSTTYAYPESAGNTVYNAKLTIQDTSCVPVTTCQSSAIYPVVIGEGLPAQIDVAIDEGLWYLHTTMDRYTSNGNAVGDWLNCSTFACGGGYIASTATNIQAFEVNGHFQNGKKTDPYANDVKRGLASIFLSLTHKGLPLSRTINNTPYGTLTYQIAQPSRIGIFVSTDPTNYQTGQVLNALVASGTPKATAPRFAPAGIAGRSYKTIAQMMVDAYVSGLAWSNSTNGGGWDYSDYGHNSAGDNSASQWAAIGIISAVRAFGVKIDPNALLWNQVWLGTSQASNGEFGYRSNSPIWGPFADTPSGMVQMALDGIGRGDPRWDAAECFMADNFNLPPGSPGTTLQTYTYGMYSFTKAMLLHDPGGVLTPITNLGEPCGQSIDWYADPNSGIATRLVNIQNSAGYWYGNNYAASNGQGALETGSAIVMLQKTIFAQCVDNLTGVAKVKTFPATISLKWSLIPNVSQYNVLRGSTSGGPYQLIGNTTAATYTDTNGIQFGATYYYVLQPISSEGSEICQSNEAKVQVPGR